MNDKTADVLLAGKPEETHQFWCSHCDDRLVDSSKTETGEFFITFGHIIGDRDEDRYAGVRWALCTECKTLGLGALR